jgi:hypothetical protein
MNQNQKWFRRKRYGYGLTPATWHGWLITFLYIIFMIALTTLLLVAIRDEPKHDPDIFFSYALIAYFTAFILSTLSFVLVSVLTGETMKWQWGKKKD